MKKQRTFIVRCLLGSMAAALMFPMASYAQTVQPDNSQLIAVLTALVQVLEQEIVTLEVQQATVQGAPDATPTSDATPAAVPAGAAPDITSASTSTMADDTQQPAAAPQFTQGPTATSSATQVGVTWQTDIPATAVLYRSASMASIVNDPDGSNYPYDPTVQVAQTWTTPQTQFTFTMDLPQPKWFYAVVITANGQSTVVNGGGNPF